MWDLAALLLAMLLHPQRHKYDEAKQHSASLSVVIATRHNGTVCHVNVSVGQLESAAVHVESTSPLHDDTNAFLCT